MSTSTPATESRPTPSKALPSARRSLRAAHGRGVAQPGSASALGADCAPHFLQSDQHVGVIAAHGLCGFWGMPSVGWSLSVLCSLGGSASTHRRHSGHWLALDGNAAVATFRPRRQPRDRPALIRGSAAKVRLASQPVGSGLAEVCCDAAIPEKSKLATKQRQIASASKLLNVQKRRIVAVTTRICPRSGEFVAVSDPSIRLEVAPDFSPKLPCKRLFRRSHLKMWGWRERASRRKSGSESEDIEGARHRTKS